MLLIYSDERALNETERQECYQESADLAHQIDAAGQYLAAAPLQPTSSAASVRIREGKRLVTDGPFAETREQLGGFFLVEAADVEEAISIAARLPTARRGRGTVEVRPVLEIPGMPESRVHVLSAEDKEFPGLAIVNRSLREAFRSELGADVEFYSESMNLSQFPELGYDGVLRDHLRRKYAGTRLDLIVAVMGPSLDFLLRHGEALFPGIPIVFCGAGPSDLEGKTLRDNVTGALVKRTFAPTLDIALQLQPDIRSVFVVGGTSSFDRQMQSIARRDFKPFESRVVITYLTTLPMDDLLKAVSSLPPNSAVLYLTLFTDGGGLAFVPHEALSLITAAANAPVYVSLDQYVGRGAVGGHVYSLDAHGRHAAEVGLRILDGEAPETISVVEPADHRNMFDWRALRRWGLDERRLPAGSIVSFRTPSAWDLYKWYVAGGAPLVVVQR